MIKFLLFNFTFLLLISSSFAQDLEDDESCLMPDKKVLKILKPTKDPKASFQVKSMAYAEAVKMAPDNAYCKFVQAEFNFERVQKLEKSFNEGRTSFSKLKNAYIGAKNGYIKVIELCSDYHASAYYKLGLIYYVLDDKKNAVKYWKAFLAFKHADPDKYPDEYIEWKKNVNDILPELEDNTDAYKEFLSKTVPFEPHLLKGVSTENDEFLPMISPDNELIFYTRRADEKGLGDMKSNVRERFTASERIDVNTLFNKGDKLKSPFDSDEFVDFGGATLSLDNKEMFICGCKNTVIYGQNFKNCDIYVTYFERSGEGGYDYSWSELKNLGPAINTKDGWEAQPTLSADGNTLYFACYRPTTKETDIFFSTRNKKGVWSMAKPVPGLNSAGHDKTPFLHQDSETMYFASQTSKNRQGSPEYGNFDMFYSRKDKEGNWTTPKNLGNPINTKGNEVGFVVSTDGHLAYFTSNKLNERAGGFDIYYFELYEEARPKKVAMIKGEVLDDKGEPVKDAIIEVSYKNTGESVEIKVNGDDGKFAAIINIEEEQDVMIAVKKEEHSFDTKIIKQADIAKLKKDQETYIKEEIAMEIGKIEVGKTFTIDNILFATNSYVLNDDSKFILNQFITFLKENPNITVTIEGHTDDLGNDDENMKLSKDRANSSMQYLISKGIAKNRLKANGYGETKPKVPNNSSKNRAINRRTDFLITGM